MIFFSKQINCVCISSPSDNKKTDVSKNLHLRSHTVWMKVKKLSEMEALRQKYTNYYGMDHSTPGSFCSDNDHGFSN